MEINDRALRLLLALEVVEYVWGNSKTEASVTRFLCPDCDCFLIEYAQQFVPFCWFCAADRQNAQKSRDLLTRTKLAVKGIYLEEGRPLVSSWPEGTPL